MSAASPCGSARKARSTSGHGRRIGRLRASSSASPRRCPKTSPTVLPALGPPSPRPPRRTGARRGSAAAHHRRSRKRRGRRPDACSYGRMNIHAAPPPGKDVWTPLADVLERFFPGGRRRASSQRIARQHVGRNGWGLLGDETNMTPSAHPRPGARRHADRSGPYRERGFASLGQARLRHHLGRRSRRGKFSRWATTCGAPPPSFRSSVMGSPSTSMATGSPVPAT